MNNTNTPTKPILRDLIATLIDIPADQATFLLSVIGCKGKVLLIDSAGRNLRPFADLLESVTTSCNKAFHKYCSPKVTAEQITAEASGKKVWFLEGIDSLPEGHQDLVAEYLRDQGAGTILIATVSSLAESETLSEELRSLFSAVIVLDKISNDGVRSELLRKPNPETNPSALAPEWEVISNKQFRDPEESLINQIIKLADAIGSVDATSVAERPPISALQSQLLVLGRLDEIKKYYGEVSVDFGGIGSIHSSLLAHQLKRVDMEGKSSRSIVKDALARMSLAGENNSKATSGTTLEEATQILKEIQGYMETVVIGRQQGEEGDGPRLPDGRKGLGTIRLMLTALFSQGHILFEDYPGTGKSYMIEMLSKCIIDDIPEAGIDIVSYKHIQCVPDLMPSDITGYEMLVGKRMIFRPGPVFAYLVLIDEINRTTPKVQAALLEAMADKRVSVGNHVYPLGDVFFVLASQNPLDQVGTYPLPAAQLDRFVFKRRLEEMTAQSVEKILKLNKEENRSAPEIRISHLARAIRVVKKVDDNRQVIHALLMEIRKVIHGLTLKPLSPKFTERDRLKEGSTPSPRSLQKLMGALKALAFIENADSENPGIPKVLPRHIRLLARDYFGHRIFPEAELSISDVGVLIDKIITEAEGNLSIKE
jgi:MoxR-like ATPase